jgi:uncharacterized membrane protein YvbJ
MWTCIKCNEEGEDNFDVCWNCGYEKHNNTPEEEVFEIESKAVDSVKKYLALRTISEINKIFGWIIILVTFIVAFVLGQGSAVAALITIITGVLIALLVFAFAEIIMVLIDIENNTRNVSK